MQILQQQKMVKILNLRLLAEFSLFALGKTLRTKYCKITSEILIAIGRYPTPSDAIRRHPTPSDAIRRVSIGSDASVSGATRFSFDRFDSVNFEFCAL